MQSWLVITPAARIVCIRIWLIMMLSSNRLWAYTGEYFISPTASKICPLHNPTTTCKGTDHGLTPKLNMYIQKYNIYILKFKNWLKIPLNILCRKTFEKLISIQYYNMNTNLIK
jgi:hypothetical protein